jgi:hypothetical protein
MKGPTLHEAAVCCLSTSNLYKYVKIRFKCNIKTKNQTSLRLPQSKLQLEYANKNIKYEYLKYNQFVAAEIEIIIACKYDKEKNR